MIGIDFYKIISSIPRLILNSFAISALYFVSITAINAITSALSTTPDFATMKLIKRSTLKSMFGRQDCDVIGKTHRFYNVLFILFLSLCYTLFSYVYLNGTLRIYPLIIFAAIFYITRILFASPRISRLIAAVATIVSIPLALVLIFAARCASAVGKAKNLSIDKEISTISAKY